MGLLRVSIQLKVTFFSEAHTTEKWWWYVWESVCEVAAKTVIRIMPWGWDASLTLAFTQSVSLDARADSNITELCPKVTQNCALVFLTLHLLRIIALRWHSETPPWMYSRSFISFRISPRFLISLWTRCTREERITSLNLTDRQLERFSSSHIPLLSSSRFSETWWFVTLLLRIKECTQWQVCSSWI